MRIAIIGAGIAGVTTAYECAADGHQVTVFERRGSVAAEASFANAGLTAPGLSLPWSPAKWPGLGGGATLAWGWQRWRAGRSKGQGVLQERLLKLALFSSARQAELRRSLQMDYERASGTLVLLRSEQDLSAAQTGLDLLTPWGLSAQVLTADQCRGIEPGLNPDMRLHGGVHLSQGESGNCRQFAHLLRGAAQRLGAQFRFHTTVRSLTPGTPAKLVHEYTPPPDSLPAPSRHSEQRDGGADTRPAPMGSTEDSFDAIIICTGADASELLRALKLKPALTQVQGYSITAPLRQLEAHPELGPQAAVYDQQRQISIGRIGQRIRVAGGIAPATASERARKSTLASLHQALDDWFPGAMQSTAVQRWQGSQALAADGLPLLGACARDGIWLNLAQGSAATLGWPLACGAARILAEQVTGRQASADLPDITGLDIGRCA
jgi:D-amino-acid dehydrogenase